MENYHIIIAKVLPWDAKHEFRISLKSHRFNQIVRLPWKNKNINDTLRTVAVAWLESKGFEILGAGMGDENTDYIVSTTFEPLRSKK